MSQLTELVTGITDDYVKRPGEWRRSGENGPPIVTDPDGLAVKSGPRAGQIKMLTYSRPSSFGKQVENTYNLEKWNERMVALGVALAGDEELAWELQNGDPDDPQWKHLVDKIVVDAKRRAGATIAADRGTHGHLLTENHDLDLSIVTRLERGEDLGLSTALQEAIVDVWQRLIDEHFEVLAVEAACVYDEWRVAGTLDRIVRLKHDLEFTTVALGKRLHTNNPKVTIPAGTVLVLDVKTGGLKTDRNGLPIYWHSYAVQVAAYACSVPYDVDSERRGQWAWDVSTDHAVIAHIDIAGALDTDVVTAQLVYVDLAAGRFAGELVIGCKEWQRRKDIFSPTGHYLTAATIAAGVDEPTSSDAARTTPLDADSAAPVSSGTATPPPLERDAVVARAKALVDAGYGLRLSYAWPPDVPGFKPLPKGVVYVHTDAELRAIYEAIVEVEDEQGLSPGWTDLDQTRESGEPWLGANVVSITRTPPATTAAANTSRSDGPTSANSVGTPNSSSPTKTTVKEAAIDEGLLVDADTYDALKARYRALPAPVLARLEQIAAQAKAAGLPIALSELHSQRRYWIVYSLVGLHDIDEDAVRDLLGEVFDSDFPRHPATPLGAAFGALSIEQARALAAMADQLATGCLAYVNDRWRIDPF